MKSVVDKGVIFWLFSGCLLVAIMVIVGGLTRLTHSGLSMVQWSLFMETIPPLTTADWMETFQLYQQTPEFKLINYDFTLSEFKSIFWWEYIHRMIGRFIGLVFFLPFVYFLIQKRLSKKLVQKLLIACLLGALQAGMGWYMVKSGLVNDPNVSHYRLAAHLTIAFLLYAYLLWIVLDEVYTQKVLRRTSSLIGIQVLMLFTFLQIIYGAFVSGLKAGLVYNTFPKMGTEWIAESVFYALETDGIISFFENLASVQLIHRYLGFAVLVLVVYQFVVSRYRKQNKGQVRSLYFMIAMVSAQVLLGIFTLLYAVPIELGVIHQFGALLLFTSQILYYFYSSKDILQWQ
ncbi:MAG: heme A synthase [Flammeovirgaceae bacterium]|nr:heme A synthase [Flammeovirgaceae bacterium]